MHAARVSEGSGRKRAKGRGAATTAASAAETGRTARGGQRRGGSGCAESTVPSSTSTPGTATSTRASAGAYATDERNFVSRRRYGDGRTFDGDAIKFISDHPKQQPELPNRGEGVRDQVNVDQWRVLCEEGVGS